MENETTQVNNEEMTPEQAKASLGIATRLTEQHLMTQIPPEAPTSPGNEPGTTEQPGQQEDVQTQIEGLETRLMDEIKSLRNEMKKEKPENDENDLESVKEEIASLKDEIEVALKDNKKEDGQEK